VAVSDRMFEAEGRWLMGRVMPRDLLKGVGKYLHRAEPEREEELVEAIKARAKELVDEDEDLPVDGPSKGMLAISATVLASYEHLLPVMGGDDRRTILLLQHIFGSVMERSMEITFEALTDRDHPLETLDKACRKGFAAYGSYFDIDFERPEDSTFEMKVSRCFFHDFFARHDAVPVTTVLCAWDANWMEALDPAVSGLRAERSSLISLGDDSCTFRVLETDDPLAEYSDALSRRFSESG
jgi:hypothetical protein